MQSPAEFVIKSIGGLTKTANAIGRPVSTVQGWKERGRVPQEHWLTLIGAAKANGVTVSFADFLNEHPDDEHEENVA